VKRTTRARGGRGDFPGQLQMDWDNVAGTTLPVTSSIPSSSTASSRNDEPRDESVPLVQHLPWDFQNTFPEPTAEAIEAGVIQPEDTEPENIKSIHEEHAREALTALHDLDTVLDARRRGVDPATGRPPRTAASRERLHKVFKTEPARLEQWFRSLMDTYEEAFGAEAADAFIKAIRARHAGIPVVAEPPRRISPKSAEAHGKPPNRRPANDPSNGAGRRVIARLPVPKPLPYAVTSGQFGHDDRGRPIRPGNHEVREITQRHAEKLIDILDSITQASGSCVPGEASRLQALFAAGLASYAESFGEHAAHQLEAYVRYHITLRDKPMISRPRLR
jgi:hypothetical protein